MCGRYYIEPDDDIKAKVEKLGIKSVCNDSSLKFCGELRPTDVAPAIANNRKLVPCLFGMGWGIPKADGRPLLINARSETAQQKPTFSGSTRNRRCLLPASRYYEWGAADETGKKTRYSFALPDRELMLLAGLYVVDAGTGRPFFTILTRDAAPHVSHIHERMPVILPSASLGAWLSPSAAYSEVIRHAIDGVELV